MSGDRGHHEERQTWELSIEERRQVLALPARERYGLFLQITVDWVLSSGADGRDVLPLWPHPAFAEGCAHGSWEGASPAAVPLDELLDDLLPLLEEDGIRVAVFPSPQGEGVLVDPGELQRDLKAELELGE